uniref:GC5 n=1 Tax=Arundo donax TaxID=35708 RepID=A0A0A9CL97_ARUDO
MLQQQKKRVMAPLSHLLLRGMSLRYQNHCSHQHILQHQKKIIVAPLRPLVLLGRKTRISKIANILVLTMKLYQVSLESPPWTHLMVDHLLRLPN